MLNFLPYKHIYINLKTIVKSKYSLLDANRYFLLIHKNINPYKIKINSISVDTNFYDCWYVNNSISLNLQEFPHIKYDYIINLLESDIIKNDSPIVYSKCSFFYKKSITYYKNRKTYKIHWYFNFTKTINLIKNIYRELKKLIFFLKKQYYNFFIKKNNLYNLDIIIKKITNRIILQKYKLISR